MDKKQYAAERKMFPLFLLFILSVFMMLAMSMRASAARASAASAADYQVNPDRISSPDDPGTALVINNASYDASTHTLTLNSAEIQGTLTFNSSTDQGNVKNPSTAMYETHYTIFLQPGTKSTLLQLKLMERVVITIKGDGELFVGASESNSNGSPLSFEGNSSGFSKLIIEGGTVTFDANYEENAIKQSGCLYVKEGAKSVTITGQTHTNKNAEKINVKGPVIQSDSSSVPKIFSDYPCQATYIPSVNGGKSVILSPNGTSDKTISDTSLLGNEYDKFHQLVFKPGYTVTWLNDDANQTVLEEDRVFYWPGQTPEYNGSTPTKAKDAQYTYTFLKWSPAPAAIYKDTVYKAVYTTTVNEDTASFDENIPIKKVKHKADKIVLKWKAIAGAEGYDIFAAFCGREMPDKPTMTVAGTKATLTKAYNVNGNSKITNDCIKYIIKAYKTVNGQKVYIAKSNVNHTVGPKHNKYSDAKKITTKKSKYKLKVGKKAYLNARATTYNGKRQVIHSATMKYESSDKSVATVNSNGKIKAVGKGSCKIYVIAACGLTKTVKVTVK